MDKNSTLNVLIVDDDEMTIFLNEIFIKESGFHHAPLIFYNGIDAIDYMKDVNGNLEHHVVFLDINMPIMDGWEFLEAAKANQVADKMYVVILTSSVNEADRSKAKQYDNVINFIEKPLQEKNLQDLMKQEQLKKYYY